MHIIKNAKARIKIRSEIIEMISEIDTRTRQGGLILGDGYYSKYLGISYPAYRKMMAEETLPSLLKLKYRRNMIAKLKEKVEDGKLPI